MFDISLEQDLAAEPVYSEIGNVSHEINYWYILALLMLTKNKIFANTKFDKNSKFCTSKFVDKGSAPIMMIKYPFILR